MSIKETENEYIFKNVLLKKLQRKLQGKFSRKMINSYQFIEDLAEEASEMLTLRIGYDVGYEDLEPVRVYYPKNGGEMFKEEKGPEILKNKFPVKYTYQEVYPKALYPSLPQEKYKIKLDKGF